MTASDGLKRAASDLAEYVQFCIDEGAPGVALSPAEVRMLARIPPPSPRPGREEGLQRIAAEIAACRRCSLHAARTRTVPGQGCLSPEIAFVGEAPGADEDREGIAFIGRAGQLLTRMIQAMGLSREDVFIANILKCRPPKNRAPLPDEMATCMPYLKAQLHVLKPRIIVALGATAARGLLELDIGITRLRGRWFRFEGIDVMPTYHPAYLLRKPAAKREAWADLQDVLARLGRKAPPVSKPR